MNENKVLQLKRITYILPYINKKLTKNNLLTIQNKNINPAHVPIEQMVKNKFIVKQRTFSDWKPEGIWASHNFNLENNNYTWLNFSFSEAMYNWIDPLKNDFYTFELRKNAKIYILHSNKKSLDQFINKYKFTQTTQNIKEIQEKLKKQSYHEESNTKLIEKIFSNLISWENLQNDGYDGIYFIKYKKFNNDLPYWFSSVDVSSICIWNPHIIKKFKKIDIEKIMKKFIL